MRAVEHGYSLAAYTMRPPTTVRRTRVLVNCAGFGEVKRTEKQEGYSLIVNLPNQTIADKHGLMFKFEIAPSRKEVLLKGLDDIGTTLQHAAAIDAYEKSHTATASMFDSVDVKYYSNGR